MATMLLLISYEQKTLALKIFDALSARAILTS